MDDENNTRFVSKTNPAIVVLLTLVFVVAVVILCELTALLYERWRVPSIKRSAGDGVALPIPDASESGADYVTSLVGGMPVGTPASDISSASLDSDGSEAEFTAGIEEAKRRGDKELVERLLERDEFAGRRLELLRALEKAKTSADKEKLLEELKSVKPRRHD